jgi:hypothetical protein
MRAIAGGHEVSVGARYRRRGGREWIFCPRVTLLLWTIGAIAGRAEGGTVVFHVSVSARFFIAMAKITKKGRKGVVIDDRGD